MAVEFALIAPLLVMLLLGIVTSGVAFSHAIGVANAVREGARFGASADATNTSQWASDVISRVRGTQFDDSTTASGSATSVCVQLWQVANGATPAAAKVATTCSIPSGGPSITITTTSPAIPTGATPGGCFVRVVAARGYSIGVGFANWNNTFSSSSVSRYQRTDKVVTCL